jgi:hypothetical protein
MKIQVTPEYLRVTATRAAQEIARYGWRPTKSDLANLRTSTGDAIAYRTLIRAWRTAGFRVAAVRKLAGRAP